MPESVPFAVDPRSDGLVCVRFFLAQSLVQFDHDLERFVDAVFQAQSPCLIGSEKHFTNAILIFNLLKCSPFQLFACYFRGTAPWRDQSMLGLSRLSDEFDSVPSR